MHPNQLLGRVRRIDLILALVAAFFAAIALVGLAAHFVPAGNSFMLGVVAFSPYLMLGAPVAFTLVLIARQWLLLGSALVLIVLCFSTQVRLFLPQDPPSSARLLVVLTTNLRLGQAEPASVLSQVRRNRVDVLMLQELTTSAQARLIEAGLNTELAYHISAPSPGDSASGTGLWSRYPLNDVRSVPGFGFAFVTARLELPSAPSEPTLVAVHMSGPVPSADQWLLDMARLPGVLRALPASAPVIVGGDFNATPDTVQFREVVTEGYRDGADQAGAGITPTYPSDRWFPPLIAIDHVLTRGGAVVTSIRTLQIAGSDHRAVLAKVEVPA